MQTLLTWLAQAKDWLVSVSVSLAPSKDGVWTIVSGVILAAILGGAKLIHARITRPTPARILKTLERSMSDLFDQLQADLKENPLVREFYALQSKGIVLNNVSALRFGYNADETKDLMNKMYILEDHGFLKNATRSTVPIYRMSETLVKYLSKRGR